MNPSDVQFSIAETFMSLLPSEGWHISTLDHACQAHGWHPGSHSGLFPFGLAEVYRVWRLGCDQRVVHAWPFERLEPLKLRERILTLLKERFQIMEPHKQAVRIATSHGHAPYEHVQALWKTSHIFWCAAGDTSIDGNFYSKRLLLGWIDHGSFQMWLHQHPTNMQALEQDIQNRIQRIFERVHTLKTWRMQAQSFAQPLVKRFVHGFLRSHKTRS